VDTAADRGPGAVPRSAFSAAPDPEAQAGGPASGAPALARESTFLDPFERALATLKRMVSNYATLAILDVRRAAVQFAWLVAGGIFLSVLLVTAWLAAVIALAVELLGSGMSWPAVLLIAAALNLVGAGLVLWRLRSVFDHVPFEATLRQFRSDESSGNASQAEVTAK
jgi:uncharacterized membrane protein YqjE